MVLLLIQLGWWLGNALCMSSLSVQRDCFTTKTFHCFLFILILQQRVWGFPQGWEERSSLLFSETRQILHDELCPLKRKEGAEDQNYPICLLVRSEMDGRKVSVRLSKGKEGGRGSVLGKLGHYLAWWKLYSFLLTGTRTSGAFYMRLQPELMQIQGGPFDPMRSCS